MWTYKTDDEKVLRLTNDLDRHDPEKGIFYVDGPIPHNVAETHGLILEGLGNVSLTRIDIQEANKLRGIELMQIDIRGNAPSKDLEMRNRQEKALRKNPMLTTMNDYKFGVEGSVPERARKKNMKKMKKKGITVKK